MQARLENVYIPDEDYPTDSDVNETESATTEANIEENTTGIETCPFIGIKKEDCRNP